MKQLITLTSDFGVQSQGVGNMEGVILGINPEANVVHLMHGIPDFNIKIGARTLETIYYLPVGFHVCVVDPGVGSDRGAIIIKVKRGDYLIGPDNGVLIPAIEFLGGFEKAVEITNEKYMMLPISPIFHGRHIFAPAAAHLSSGVPMENFGPEIPFEKLVEAPYQNAVVKDGTFVAEVININKFGSLNLNILQKTLDELGLKLNNLVLFEIGNQKIEMPYVETFSQVKEGEPLIMKDDYGRVEVAINLGNFAKKYDLKVGDRCIIKKSKLN